MELLDKGLGVFIEWVLKLFVGMVHDFMKTLNTQSLVYKARDFINSEAFQGITNQAVAEGVIDEVTLREIQVNALALLAKPEEGFKAAAQIVERFSENPEYFILDLKQRPRTGCGLITEQLTK
jgi:molybdopterin synthase catalytic subunit